MAKIENKNPSGKIEKGATLYVSGASSENEAILAVENYLRENRSEELAITIAENGTGDGYEIRLD
ncbi:hypothetical protein [Dyadobacter aurulentus]|uniref:hypothetical protein n=1 Tax=Dyadobacter sp. UC 10 TaxID=2605428 RepID=UPI0011F256A2|nr:hypothetical protein [Dyadobacter sp. UC 10]KAA0992507.1 hypothetical protein FXO21_21225 [Dyadobacter sp. UC 10]